MPNLGGYDINNFYDSKGNAFLISFLEQDCNIKTDIKKDDKAPNLDGTIELLKKSDKVSIPVQIFHVQVKTLNKSYVNKNKKENISQYKYSADTKVFNVVKEHITSDPVILFLVDTKNKKVFWFYVSIEYVMKLGIKEEKNKTIYFNDTDSIVDMKLFYRVLENIHQERVAMNKNWQNNIITSNYTRRKEQDILLQKEWDYLNEMLSKKYKVAVEYLYPDAWKFGLAYQEGEKFDTIGIYQIKYGDNGQIIKDFSNRATDCFTVSTYKKDVLSIRDVINKQIGALAEKYYKSGHIPVRCLPDIALEEISFHFLDIVARSYRELENSQIALSYYKNTEDVSEIRHIWNALVKYSIRQNQFIIDKYANMPHVTAEVNPLGALQSCNAKARNKAREIFGDLLKEEKEDSKELPYPLVFSEKFEYQLYCEVIRELESRGIKTVSRLWEPKKYELMFEEQNRLGLKGFERIETGYLIADIYTNCDTLFRVLAEAYKFACRAIWKENTDAHIIKKEYAITYDKTEGHPCYYCVMKESTDFVIKVNGYSEEQMKGFIADAMNGQTREFDSVRHGLLTICTRSELPLYDNIRYLINKEMWENSGIAKPVNSTGYIW